MEKNIAIQQAEDTIKLNEAKEEVYSGIKELVFNGQKVYVRHPSVKESNELDKIYSEKFYELVKEGKLPTVVELEKVLEKKGVWTEKDEEDFVELQKRYAEAYKEWYSYPYNKRDSDDYKAVQENYEITLKKFMKAYINKQTLFDNTVEKKAEAYTIQHQLVMCIFKDKECTQKLFNSIDDIYKYDKASLTDLVNACLLFWRGVSERFLELLPENLR